MERRRSLVVISIDMHTGSLDNMYSLLIPYKSRRYFVVAVDIQRGKVSGTVYW